MHLRVITKESRGTVLKKVNWVFVIIVLIGFVLGGCIGNLFDNSIINYSNTFGLDTPIVLNLGFIILTFGLKIQISIASVIGVIIALLIYKFIR